MDTLRITALISNLKKDLSRLETAVANTPLASSSSLTPSTSSWQSDGFRVDASSILPTRTDARQQRIDADKRTLARRLRIGVTPDDAIMKAALWEKRKSEFTNRAPAILTSRNGMHGYRLRNVGHIDDSGTVYNRMTGLPIQPRYNYRTEFAPESLSP